MKSLGPAAQEEHPPNYLPVIFDLPTLWPNLPCTCLPPPPVSLLHVCSPPPTSALPHQRHTSKTHLTLISPEHC